MMKVAMGLRDFKDALKKTKEILKGCTFKPLKYLLVEGNSDNGVILTANNLYSCVEVRIDDGDVLSPGEVVIDFETLLIVEKFKDIIGTELVITDEKIIYGNKEVTFFVDEEFKANNFPRIVDCKIPVMVVPSEELNDILRVVYACDKTELRGMAFQGVCIDNHHFVASDTYILAKRRFEYENNLPEPVIIHHKDIALLRKLLKDYNGDVHCCIDNNENVRYMSFEIGNIRDVIRLLSDGKFPEWRNIKYPDPQTTITVNAKELLNELKILQSVVKKDPRKQRPIDLDVKDGVLTLMGKSLEGDRTLTTKLIVEQDGVDMDCDIRLDVMLLLRIITECGDVATIDFAGEKSLIVVDGSDILLPINRAEQ